MCITVQERAALYPRSRGQVPVGQVDPGEAPLLLVRPFESHSHRGSIDVLTPRPNRERGGGAVRALKSGCSQPRIDFQMVYGMPSERLW